MKSLLARCARRAIGPIVAGLFAVSVVSSGGGGAFAATAPPPPFVELHGQGAWSMFEEQTAWHNQLAGAQSPIDLGYTPFGSFLGRQNLLTGSADYAISGVGFTADQLKETHHTNADFISAPVAVATLAMLMLSPAGAHPGYQSLVVRCDPSGDPATWPPDVTDPFDPVHGCIVWTPYQGNVRIPAENLAAMLLDYQFDANGRTENEPLSSWNNPSVLAAFGVSDLSSVPPHKGPTAVLRSDSDETNYYLQKFAAQFAPTVWTGLHHVDSQAKWDPITETLPRQLSVSRGYADQQAELLASGGDPGSGSPALGGGIADVPPSANVAVDETYPNSHLGFAQLKNANGDWVFPTPAAIDAAVNAGGETPLYAFSHKVPGAYPFVWVDRLYAPAHGLSVEKTEGLAMLIRYLATAGQDAAAPVGEGRLSQPLVTQALAAADALVQSNCVGADRQIVSSSDPGPTAPSGTLTGIGSMLHCEPAGPPTSTTTTTTVASSSTSTPTVPLTTPSDSGFGDIGTPAATPTASPGAPTPSGLTTRVAVIHRSSRHRASLLTVASLPLSAPGGAPGLDRLGTFMLGAALYLLLRRPARRMVRSVVT